MENNMKYHIKGRDSMKTIDVIFVSDELVGSTIVSKKDYERLMRQKSKTEAEKFNLQKNENNDVPVESKASKRRVNQSDESNGDLVLKKSKFIDDVELALAALECDDVEKLDISHPSTLFGEGDVSAKKICGFGNSVGIQKNAKVGETMNISKIKSNTEKNNKVKNESVQEDCSQTSILSSKKVINDIQEIQKILENSDEDEDFSVSDSDSSFKMSDDSCSEKEDFNIKSPPTSKSFFEGYCDLQSAKKSKTSANSTNKLKTPKLTQEKLDEIVKNFEISSTHKNCIQMLVTEIFNMFDKWDYILKQNYNIVLYGAGSKREIISKFVERYIHVSPVIVVNGFFPDISVKEIVEKLCSILNIKFDSVDAIEKIQNKIKNYNIEIYIAVNNIDGIMLRSKKAQSSLSQLAKMKQIHVIASIDHINAPLIWEKRTSSEFNWVWYDSTTFLSYSEETLYEGNLMLQTNGKATLLSLRNVFNSLTKNSQGIFIIMVKNQLELGNQKVGISFRELYQECRNELLISSDVALRAQLKEFIDHMILKQKKSADGEEKFVITMENSILRQFLEEQEMQS